MKTSRPAPGSHALALLALACVAMGATSVSAATIVVTSAADSGAGSLRQAITDSAVGGRIEFAPSLSGATIYLASTLTIDKGLAIDGSTLPVKITISGDSDANGTGNFAPVIDASSVDLITLAGTSQMVEISLPSGQAFSFYRAVTVP